MSSAGQREGRRPGGPGARARFDARFGSMGRPPPAGACRRRSQAGTGAWAEKIDSWAVSGSITPMIFWTERTWTHVFQLSK